MERGNYPVAWEKVIRKANDAVVNISKVKL